MENLKNEFVSEMLHVGFTPEQAVKALQCLAVVAQGYNITPKDANLAPYNGGDAALRLVRLYADCKRVEGCSKGFCTNLETILPKLFEYAGKDVQDVTSFDIRGFLADWQRERNISNATLDKYRQYINGFYEWLTSEGYSGKNPCRSIKKIKQEKKEKESLSQMELEQIRLHTINSEERMIIEVLYSTGCRIAELVGIKLSDIRWQEEQTVVHVVGKGGKHRTVPLNAKAQIAIKAFLAERKFESDYLCASKRAPHLGVCTSSVRNIIKEINARVAGNISHYLHPHLFRHTTATIALNNGMPIQEVQQLLGHSSLNTTMLYVKTDKNSMFADHAKTVV